MLQLFGYISGVLSVLCILPYIRDIFLRKTTPARATWLIWSVLGNIAFFSQWAEGASHSLWMTGAQTAAVTVTFLLSIKYGVGGLSRRDIITLIVAAGSLIAWYFTHEAAVALLIVIFIDILATYITIVKAYKEPHTETTITWVLAGIAGVFSMLAVGVWDWVLLIYPLWIAVGNGAVLTAMALGGKWKRGSRRLNQG